MKPPVEEILDCKLMMLMSMCVMVEIRFPFGSSRIWEISFFIVEKKMRKRKNRKRKKRKSSNLRLSHMWLQKSMMLQPGKFLPFYRSCTCKKEEKTEMQNHSS